MKCDKCSNSAKIGIKPLGKLCEGCYCRTIERRVRKNARLKKMFSKGDNLVVVGELCKYFTESIVGKMPVKMKFVKKMPGKTNMKIVVPNTADDEINSFLSGIMLGKKVERHKNWINLLSCITDEEAIEFAKCKKLSFQPLKKDKDIMNIVDELQKKYSETKFSIIKGIDSFSIS